MDAVEQAKSGHPGTPMALAPLIYTLWQRILRFDPDTPLWPNRDRFVLSNGHASMLLYAVLYLAGVKAAKLANGRQPAGVSLDDIKRFRQIGSACPGHPEYGLTAGVESTTGPLGQGCGNSVGMALAGRWLAHNRPAGAIFDYPGVCDLQRWRHDGRCGERSGVLAPGTKGSATCAGSMITTASRSKATRTSPSSEDVAGRFRAYGWRIARVADVNDIDALAQALDRAKADPSAPSLIIVNSHIGFGAPHKQDTSAAHGEPLSEGEVRLAKRSYGWPEDAKFLVPDGVRKHFEAGCGARGRRQRQDWDRLWASYRRQCPDRRARALRPKGIDDIDCGISGGVWGLERGYSLMIGGAKDAVERLDPIFSALAPGKGAIAATPGRGDRDPRVERGYMHCGPSGAGRCVKMSHNGIEYGLMQAYAEGFNILRGAASDHLPKEQRFHLDLADIAEAWRRGSVISSWLLYLTAMALAEDPGLTRYTGNVEDSGEGRWTVHTVPAEVLSAALYTRFRSREQADFADKILSAMRNKFGGHLERAGAP
jgi:6-phosphogluconate dehydrogenase (decarboxylating)/transketolase N-terminal domain/subunit